MAQKKVATEKGFTCFVFVISRHENEAIGDNLGLQKLAQVAVSWVFVISSNDRVCGSGKEATGGDKGWIKVQPG